MSSKVRSIKREIEKRDAPGTILVKLEDLIACTNPVTDSLGNPIRPSVWQVLMSQSVPAKVAFDLSKIAKAIASEREAYEAARKGMCERYAEKDSEGKPKMVPVLMSEDGKSVMVPEHYDILDEKMVDFNKELAELHQTEVSLIANPIKIESLSSINVPAAHLFALAWLIVE